MRATSLLSLALLAALALPGCSAADEPKGDPDHFVIQAGRPGTPPIKVEVLARGDGAKAEPGSVVAVHYALSKLDGTAIETSRTAGGRPFEFRIGAPMSAIEGWHIVAQQMRVGDRWNVTLPPEFAYGDQGAGPDIPGGTTLVFDMELMSVR